ncbi:sulfite exporter TauE/SafE family protein [Euryhalocaulis caribicus]|uniref:sulfite exporter TauE/SafE family protein n=1 Tax=Euryhalocaulis caribicus TaxID=1161401 RepID=UPI0003A78C94|nr:sulfite exporter TauE/SafE family protein [Euryhalocaulis caribicus]
MTPDIIFLIAALIGAGLFAGLVAGLFGVGGGVVIVPAVYYAQAALGYPEETRMHVAVATSLATIIATSIRSVMAHNKKGAVDWHVLRAWSPWIVLGALAGAFVADMTPGRALTAFFGAVAMLIAAQMFFGRPGWRLADELPGGLPRAGMGTGMGLASAMMGIGGGTFGVLLMTLCGRSIHKAVGTAAGFGVAIGAPAALGFVIAGWGVANVPPGSLGYVSAPGFFFIATLTVLMAPVGAALAHRLDGNLLRRLFAIGLTVTAFSLLYEALAG